jgi:hypothetical protein
MTPHEFHDSYRPTADAVGRGTGIDAIVLLAQWANETAWGTVVIGNNLGNIRCSSTSFCRYPSLAAFAAACIATWHNGFYGSVFAAQGAEAQLAAICASPWSSGHYGGNLHPFYDPLEAYELTPDEHKALFDVTVALLRNPVTPGVDYLTWWQAQSDKLDALKAQIAAIPATGGPVNLQPVLTAVAALASKVDTNDADVDAALGNLLAAIKGLTLKAA